MPHFIVECSHDILLQKTPDEILDSIYETADATGLFAPNDIKVRLQPYQYFRLGNGKKNFLHVFGYIMEGRTTVQKADLSKQISIKLTELLPEISFCLSTSVSLKWLLTAIKPLSTLKTLIGTVISGYKHSTSP
jgi:5-carboxymethyl-2-hydroxymuconate isomerase